MKTEKFLPMLRNVKTMSDGYSALCPSHNDHENSLHVAESETVGILLHCFAGCSPEAIVSALGLEMRELFPGDGKSRSDKKEQAGRNRTIPAETVRAKLEGEGFRVVAEFTYGPDLRKVRLERPMSNGAGKPKKTFRWEYLESGSWWAGNGGKQKPLYVNSLFHEGSRVGPVLGFEGEAKADLAGDLGFPAFSYKEFTPAHCEVLSGRDAVFFPDKDASGDRQCIRVATILSESKQARSIGVITPPEELAVGGDIVDAVHALGWDRERVLRLIDDAKSFTRDAEGIAAKGSETNGNTEAQTPKRESQSAQLIELAAANGVELFHTGAGDAYITVPVNSHSETWPVKSTGFGRWLRWQFYRLTAKAPSAQAFQDAVNTIAAKATYEGQERPVFTRVAEMDGAIYLDLANAAWEVVKIDARGWQVVKDAPVRFVRRRGMLPLPIPANGCGLKELRRFVNLGGDADWLLLAAWIVAALRLRGPYPILILHGEQGSAKSSLARVARELIDPNSAPLRSEPRDARDLIIAANNSWVLAFDNLSHLPVWFSDALCRLATGGGFSTRELYTDSEEVLFDAVRPVILNGIEELATRGDLLDRAVILYLPQISNEKRKREADFWKDFADARPQLLGAALDAVSTGLRNLPTISLKETPRMADFAAWAAAAEPSFGVKGVSFAQAYKGNLESANDLVLDSSQVAQAVKSLVADGSFRGSATELLAALNHKVSDEMRREKSWPKDGRGLSNRLRRLAPNLRQVGLCIKFDLPYGRGKDKKRVIELEKLPDSASPPSPSSPEPENDGEETTFEDMPTGTQNEMRTQTASPPKLPSPPNPLEINNGDTGDGRDANFPSFSRSADGEEEPDYGEI